jgi:hypothetical protein
MWKAMGGKVHCYADAKVSHAGTFSFKSWLGLSLRIARESKRTAPTLIKT